MQTVNKTQVLDSFRIYEEDFPKWSRANQFPKPDTGKGKSSIWKLSAIQAWQAARIEALQLEIGGLKLAGWNLEASAS